MVFQTPLWQRLFSVFGFTVCAALGAFMAGTAIFFLLRNQFGLAAILALCAAFQVALARYVGRDLRGKWGLRVELMSDSLSLQLPSGRSLIHRPPALRATIPYADIAALETRLEGYRSLVMAMLQRAYALRRKSGEIIFLCEDRAIGSSIEARYCEPIVKAIVARTQAPLRDFGMVEGKGGVLGVWGTETVDWRTPSLDEARQRRIGRAVYLTGYLAALAVLIAWFSTFL